MRKKAKFLNVQMCGILRIQRKSSSALDISGQAIGSDLWRRILRYIKINFQGRRPSDVTLHITNEIFSFVAMEYIGEEDCYNLVHFPILSAIVNNSIYICITWVVTAIFFLHLIRGCHKIVTYKEKPNNLLKGEVKRSK